MDERGTEYKIKERLRHVYHRRVEEQRQRLQCPRLCITDHEEERPQGHMRPSNEVEEQRQGFVGISTFANAPPEKSIFAAEPAVSHATTAAPGRRWTLPPQLTQANDGFARLHKGDDFTSSPSSNTLQEFGDVWLAAAERQLSLRPKSPSPEELTERRQERKRKGLLTDLEFVEEKERNQVYGRGALYVHSNFLVKGSDGKPTMFFAEMHPDCTQEEDVVCCTPLEENDYGATHPYTNIL
ncbi:hypothetical protein TRIUR3_28593 [Triticum urartu]|uniref:DUF3615 domain-containing protein n=1 Tax=Triticum urartu TaxID=4572 RepID=M7YTP4_TRIUA|nr:hypothetical protein TRIUR3_28593 [Triticum urartu]